MRHLVDLIPLPRVFAEVVLIVGLFLSAIVVSRVAGLVAAWLVSRRAVQGEDAPADAVARLQQRETAASLTQTSVRYLAFGLALVLSIIVLSGVRHAGALHPAGLRPVRQRPLRQPPGGGRPPVGGAGDGGAARADALHPPAAGRGDGAARQRALPDHRRRRRRAGPRVARRGPPPEAR